MRHAASLPQAPLVVATGCVANLFADELSALAPNVTVVRDKSRVSDAVLDGLGAGRLAVGDDGELLASHGSASSTPTPTGRTRPGIKIQDGCNNRCTFCIVWKARGASRSVPTQQVLEEVRAAQARGAHEVVLTGINLGNFRGEDAEGTYELPGLIERMLRETSIERIRLSSIEPPDVTEELVGVMAAAGERVAPFLHVCLQSGCDRTLHDMGRVYTTEQYARAISQARAALPQLSLGTDLIVGFPGETDDDFEQSLAFCGAMSFSRMHVFRYSRRPGTPAAARTDQVSAPVSARRSERMLELAARMRHAQAMRCVGGEELVVVQYPGRGVSGGLFDVLVDDSIPVDALVRVRVRGVLEDGTLDARSNR